MCVIMKFAPGARMNKQQFYNAVYNNPDGFGLILKDANQKLQLIKRFDPKGTNPDDVWKLITENEDVERFLHVRWNTKGASDESNTQPFEVYNSSERQIFFMHNGTLYQFGTASGKSDTLDFCEKILQPALLRWRSEKGLADYTDPLFNQFIIEKNWAQTSKGLLVSNDLDNVFIGQGWSLYNHPDETDSYGEIKVSNTEYFSKLERGFMFQKLEEERKKKEKEEREKVNPLGQTHSNTSSGDSGVKIWKGDVNKSKEIIEAMNKVINTWTDLDNEELLKNMRYVTYDEVVAILEEMDVWTQAAFFQHLMRTMGNIHVRSKLLERKWKKAEGRLNQFAAENVSVAA